MAYFVTATCAGCRQLRLRRAASTSIKGWIYGIREHKDVNFLDVGDGSQSKHVQVVASNDVVQQVGRLRFGDCLVCEGDHVVSPGPRQKTEFHAKRIIRVAENDVEPSTGVGSLEQVRHSLSTRAKHPLFSALMRFRSQLAQELRMYFQRQDYVEISCPILTTANCEAADCFTVLQSNKTNSDQSSSGSTQHESSATTSSKSAYFGDKRVLLTGSAQFHLEAFATGFSRTYSFAPTFRAEPSRTRHHLAEFSMVEAELCFVETLDALLLEIETFFRSVVKAVLRSQKLMADIQIIEERLRIDAPNRCEIDADGSKRQRKGKKASRHRNIEQRLCDVLSKQIVRVTYADALEILVANNSRFERKVDHGDPIYDIQKEHEKFLVHHFDEAPVFLTNFPAKLKPFYMLSNSANHDPPTSVSQVETVACADLLVPDVGELVGGSLRENNLSALEHRVAQISQTPAQRELVDWYLQLRRAGLPPHAGYGVGFERLLQFVLRVANIRDVIPFYRFYGSCDL